MSNIPAVYGHYGCFNANGGVKKKEKRMRESKKETGNRNQKDKQQQA